MDGECSPMDAMTAQRAARIRVAAREKPPRYVVTGLARNGQHTQMQVSGGPGSGEFFPPSDVGEWFDDQLKRLGISGDAASAHTLVAIIDAARGSEKQARAAVSQARKLTDWDQWQLWRVLQDWRIREIQPQVHTQVTTVMNAILAEWRHLGLVTELPDPPDAVIVTLNQADLDAADERRRANRSRVSRKWRQREEAAFGEDLEAG